MQYYNRDYEKYLAIEYEVIYRWLSRFFNTCICIYTMLCKYFKYIIN